MKLLLGLMIWPLLKLMRHYHLGEAEMKRQQRLQEVILRVRAAQRAQDSALSGAAQCDQFNVEKEKQI